MSMLATVVLGASLVTAPVPPARPEAAAPAPAAPAAEVPASADEMQKLLDEVRRIHGANRPAPVVPAPAPPAAPATGGAPAASPMPPPRQPAGPPTEGRRLVEPAPVAEQQTAPAAPAPAVPAPAAPGAAAAQAAPAAGNAPAPQAAAPGRSPFPQRRPIWTPRRAEAAGDRLPQPGPASEADDPGRREADAAGRDAAPQRQAPQMVPKPLDTTQAARPATPAKLPVCRDPRIDGTMIPQIVHPSWPCGIAQPVRVNAIAGIRLSTPATLDCHTASQLATWVTGVLAPAARTHLGASIDKMWVMGSYACRRRNNRPSGKLSEHARGRAIDIGGVWLKDGRKVTLTRGWGKGAEGRFLAEARSRACGLFHTVLGPGSDRHHHDHLHFDTSPRGGDPYCR